jgi:hypothetical protein
VVRLAVVVVVFVVVVPVKQTRGDSKPSQLLSPNGERAVACAFENAVAFGTRASAPMVRLDIALHERRGNYGRRRE